MSSLLLCYYLCIFPQSVNYFFLNNTTSKYTVILNIASAVLIHIQEECDKIQKKKAEALGKT